MKILSLLFLLFISVSTYSQEFAKPYPDSVKSRIRKQVEVDMENYGLKLNKEYKTKEWVKYELETYVIIRTNELRQEYDFSTEGMNNSVIEMTNEYMKLVNKYYGLLLARLRPSDKAVLVESQKLWMRQFDQEKRFIAVLRDEAYNIGGTLQSSIAVGRVHDIVSTRLDQLFSYYDSIIEKDELENSLK